MLSLDGGLVLDTLDVSEPEAGTIRWTGSDLEGWNGITWMSLTGDVLDRVVDGAGNSYKTLRLGQDIWMIENLRTDMFNDGISISEITLSSEWSSAKIPAVSSYDNRIGNLQSYGYLYNRYGVIDNRICPLQWHVSTAEDWTALLEYYNGQLDAGATLKEAGTIFWQRPNEGATNESGFSARPGGSRMPTGDFVDIGLIGDFWSLDTMGLATKNYRLSHNSTEVVEQNVSTKNWGLSIRCVKNRN